MDKTLVIKFSGEFFKSNELDTPFSEEAAEIVFKALKKISNNYLRTHLIVGGGNFLRGRNYNKLVVPRGVYDKIGMQGTVMNAQWLSKYFELKGISSYPLSTSINPFVHKYTESFVKNKPHGTVFVHGGGTNFPYLSTDTLTVLLAIENNAKDVLFAKQGAKGIYDKDPNQFKDAKFIEKITFTEIIREDLKVMDLAAASVAREGNLTVKIFNFTDEASFEKVLSNKVKHSTVTA